MGDGITHWRLSMVQVAAIREDKGVGGDCGERGALEDGRLRGLGQRM